MNIFVGNLSNTVKEEDLIALFSEHGQVKEVKIIRDLFTRESKGFGFVEMPGLAEAQKAISSLNTIEVKGKKINVSEARPKRNNKRNGNRGGYGQSRRRY